MKRLRLPIFLFCLLATCATRAEPQASPQSVPCEPLSSLAELGTTHRIVLLGETHGTKEIPAYFFDVICTAVMALPVDRPIVVGLEYFADDNVGLQTYLGSDGGEGAVRALMRGGFWNTPMQDGRTSVAMLGLLDKLRRLTQERKNVSVLAFDPAWPYPAGISRDQGMANLIEQAIVEKPSAVLVALVGDYHARLDEDEHKSLASKLKSEFRSYRFVFSQGSNWSCDGPQTTISCGVKTVSAETRAGDQVTRELVVSDADPEYHGVINLVNVSASAPAKSPQNP